MSNIPSKYDEEIDLTSLIQTVWDGKWKIASILAVLLLSVFGFYFLKVGPSFIATTEIKSITSVEFDKYSLFNSSLKVIPKVSKDEKDEISFNLFKITPISLLKLYIEIIQEGSLLETAINRYNLINKDDFDSETEYKDAIEKFASEIEVVKPMIQKNGTLSHHILMVEYDDEDKWKNLLKFVNDEANRKVKASIITRFATMVSIQNQKKKFAIKDLDIKIDNVKKDYERNTKNRLAFLAEQAAIARKLDIPKNTIASQRFNAQNTFVTNVKTDAPFYLRGYLAIEEEIKQITARKNKNAFIKDLFKLEQQKRDLEQDKTIARAIDLFNKTPLNQNDFQATIVKVATTDFKKNDKLILYCALTTVFGGIIGVFYVLIANAFKNRRNNML